MGTTPDLGYEPVTIYGNSYSILSSYFFTGEHYSVQAARTLRGGGVTSYGVAGRRIVDVCATLVNGNVITGTSGVIAAGKWDGTRRGLQILESVVNDAAHYPNMTLGVALPAAITTTNTRYLDGLKGMYRLALAVLSSKSRVEDTSATKVGTWTSTGVGYASAGNLAFTSTPGDHITYTVTPAQTGPYAGRVWHVGYKLDPAVAATCATVNVSIDGGAAKPVSITPWEQYVGHSGANVSTVWDCFAIDLPVDGAAHTVRLTHAGAAASFLYTDAILVPDVDPNPVAVMGAELSPYAVTGVWSQADVDTYKANLPKVLGVVQEVTAEFETAFYVPSTMTDAGLYSADGIHPNDTGMAQRAADLVAAAGDVLMDDYLYDRVVEYLGAGTGWTTDQIRAAFESEREAQAELCVLPDPPAVSESLVAALNRRVQHALSLVEVPLGMQATITEFANLSQGIGGTDAEVARLEAPFGVIPFA